MKQKVIKQTTGRIWLGRAKVTFSRVGQYFSYINFLLILITFYSVTGYEYAPLWLFVVAACVAIVSIGTIDYFVVLPSEQAFMNEQFAKHQNPLWTDIKANGE